MRGYKYSSRNKGILLLSLLAGRDSIVHAIKSTSTLGINVSAEGNTAASVRGPTSMGQFEDDVTANIAMRDYSLYGLPIDYHVQENQIKKRAVQTSEFDTDSYEIRVDNCCSKSLSFNKIYFVLCSLAPVTTKVVGLAGHKSEVTHVGTLKWSVLDDSGIERIILIPESLLVPKSTVRLLHRSILHNSWRKTAS
jgi:hypothetical protein